jgi:acyl carrier protein
MLTQLLARPVSRHDDAHVPLRDLGLTSLRMIQLLGELETAFDIRIADDEVGPENFDTFDQLVAYVTRKRGGSS